MEMARSAIVEAPARMSGERTCWAIGSAVVTAALLEVSTHPKPGLVTPRSNGAHVDMDLQTFMASTAAIAPCFYLCAQRGLNHRGSSKTLLPKIREIGREYERHLLNSTGGVNTQRGLLFSGGILCAAAGLLSQHPEPYSAAGLFAAVAEMTEGLCARELQNRGRGEPTSAGEMLFERFGVLGIRGEVEAGFPTVRDAGLPGLAEARAAGVSRDRILVHTLLSLMAKTEDSTVLWRGGWAALEFVRTKAQSILEMGGALSLAGWEEVRKFDAECIAHDISPGGSADLMAITIGIQVLVEGNTALQGPDGQNHRAAGANNRKA